VEAKNDLLGYLQILLREEKMIRPYDIIAMNLRTGISRPSYTSSFLIFIDPPPINAWNRADREVFAFIIEVVTIPMQTH
jgi:hypothetical protein